MLQALALAAGGSLLAACQQQPAAQPTAAPAAKPPAPAATTAPAAPAKPTTAPAKPAAAATSAPAAAAKPTAAASAKPAAAQTAPAAAKPAAGAVDMAAIEAAAKKEGKVVVYSSFNLDEFDKVYPLFEKRFPGIKVDHVRGNGEQLVQRMITESRGGRVLADVLETNASEVFNVISVDLMERFSPPEAAAFPAGLKDPEGIWTSTRQNVDIVAYNTNLVKPEDAPKVYDDLLDPKWKGKIMVEADDIEVYGSIILNKFGGNFDQAQEWLKKLAANNVEGFKGHTETTELLAAGQAPIFLGAYAHRIESLKKKKAPLEWSKGEGVQLLQAGGVVKNSPNPNAGKLFMNWLLTDEAQAAISKIGRIPSRPGVKLEVDFFSYGTKWFPAPPSLAKDFERNQKAWKETLGLRG